MPPNSKGGAFINDPAMTNAREITGQTKLSFLTANNKKAIVTRSMLLTLKKSTRQFKTLDSNISIRHKDGKELQLNSRCADIDQEMSRFLGVSKAVLEYVIFCHQEDSLWPLAEPSTVKKRFDDIFEATQYTKALDDMKFARKEYNLIIVREEKDVESTEITKDRAEQTQKRANEAEKKINEASKECEALQKEIDSVTKEQTKLFETHQRFQKVLYRIEQLTRDKRAYEETIQRLESAITEILQDSDEELQDKLDNFRNKTDERRQAKIELEEKAEKLKVDLKDERHKSNALNSQYGKLKAKKEAHDEDVQKLEKFITNAIDDLKLDCPPDANSLISNLQEKVDELDRLLERARVDANAAEQDVSNQLNELYTERTKAETKKNNAKDTKKNSEKKIETLEEEIESLIDDEAEVTLSERNLERYQEQYKKAKAEYDEKDFDEEIGKKRNKRSELEQNITKLNNEFKKATQQADTLSKLEFLENDLNRKKVELDNANDKNGKKLKDIVGNVENSLAERELNKRLQSLQTGNNNLSSKITKLQSDKAATKTRVEYARKQLTSLENEIEQKEKELSESFGNREVTESSWQEMMTEFNNTIVKSRAAARRAEILQGYINDALEKAQGDSETEPHCILCHRGIDPDESTDVLIQMRAQLNEEKKNLNLQKDVQDAEDNISLLKELKPQIERVSELRDDLIPKAEYDIKTADEELDDLEQQIENVEEEIETTKKITNDSESLRKYASDIARWDREITQLSNQVDETKSKLGEGNTRTTQQIQTGLSKVNSEIKTVDGEIASLTENRDDANRNVQQLESKISETKLKISNGKNKQFERTNKESILNQTRELVQKCRDDIAESEKQLANVEPQISQLDQKMKRLKNENEKRAQKMREEKYRFSKIQTEADSLHTDVNSYKGDADLEQCKQDMKDIKRTIDNYEQELQELTSDIAAQRDALNNMSNHERNLRDNLEIRRLQNEIAKIDNETTELDEQRALQQKQRYDSETTKLQEKLSNLSGEKASREGQIGQMKNTLKEYNEDLENQYKDAKELHREAVLKLAVTRAAMDDLARYSKAVEHAVMKFHSMKMERINATIGELWRQTYTGTDVDTIMIKSDNESGKGNRTYHYRVVMVKGDCELDMRGRCSAGQKVLACIIIRLALAETFGQNCGMIALDEPTTNLDKQNIEALAQSLNELLEMRKTQKNFQLITITHDQEFLRHIRASEYVDHYYQVKRDGDRSSRIVSTDIANISA